MGERGREKAREREREREEAANPLEVSAESQRSTTSSTLH